ncbi:hypothetical protein PRIPAC_81815, partial [Pristionchus pacificus]
FRMRSDASHSGSKFITDLCVGGAAAAVSKTVVAPIERIKLLLQVQNTYAGISTSQRYTGIMDAFVRVPKEQGFLSFWRGNATNVLRYFPTQALNFAFNDLFRSKLVRKGEEKGSLSYLARSMAAGGLAGSTTMCFVYPLDFIRTRISVDVGRNKENREYKGIVDCARKTISSNGVQGLYRGFFISIQTYFIYRAVYFGLYDTVRGMYEKGDGLEKRKLNFFASFLLAEGVTVCASYLTYPWDTVRRRMMIKGELVQSSTVEAVKKIVKSEGFLGLYKGALANILRSTGSALVMALYHELQEYLK